MLRIGQFSRPLLPLQSSSLSGTSLGLPLKGRVSANLIIFDVDGTLRWTRVPGQASPHHADEWDLLPNVRRTMCSMRWSATGPRLAVATNQPDVARGHVRFDTARHLIEETLRRACGGELPTGTWIEMCVHPAELECDCRMPQPGMIHRILERTGTPPRNALFVGDLESDREAARRAGVKFVRAHEFFGWRERP